MTNQIDWLEGIESSLLFGDPSRDLYPYLNPDQDVITFQNVLILHISWCRFLCISYITSLVLQDEIFAIVSDHPFR